MLLHVQDARKRVPPSKIDICPAIVRDSQETSRVMFRWTWLTRFADDLIQQPAPGVSTIADFSRNSPRFQRYPQRIRKQDCRVKSCLSRDQASGAEKGFVR